MLSVLNGFNACLLCYGQTGSGKTCAPSACMPFLVVRVSAELILAFRLYGLALHDSDSFVSVSVYFSVPLSMCWCRCRCRCRVSVCLCLCRCVSISVCFSGVWQLQCHSDGWLWQLHNVWSSWRFRAKQQSFTRLWCRAEGVRRVAECSRWKCRRQRQDEHLDAVGRSAVGGVFLRVCVL